MCSVAYNSGDECHFRAKKMQSDLFPCFQASQPDELTIEEQEILEVIDDGDMEDWVKVLYMYIHTCELHCSICSYRFQRNSFVLFFMFVMDFPPRLHIFCISRPEIAVDRLATSQRNTCSFLPPTVC